MKRISTLLVSSLFSLSLLAYDGSGLSISKVNTNMNFKVEVDGHNVFIPGNTVTLDYLNEGYHNVRVFREIIRNDFGKDHGRSDERLGRYDQIIFSTSVYLDKKSRTDVTINSSGKVFVDSYQIGSEVDWYNTDDKVGSDNNGNTIGSGWGYRSGKLMTEREFQIAKDAIRNEWFEQSRLTLAKTIMDKNYFTTQQVKEMMLLFTFENNRMEIAKYGYRKTVDNNNYYLLNDALTFNSTKDELARFIRES
jgi:hypothetical protein